MSDIDELKKLAEAAGFEVSSEITWEGVICTEEVAELVSLVRTEQADAIERLQRELGHMKERVERTNKCWTDAESECRELKRELEDAREALETIAAQRSDIPGSTAKADCMASVAIIALRNMDAARQQEG